jgi:hypothetical protein
VGQRYKAGRDPRIQFKVTKINSPAYSSLRIPQIIFAVTSEGTTVWVTVSCNKLAHGVFVARGTVQKITP